MHACTAQPTRHSRPSRERIARAPDVQNGVGACLVVLLIRGMSCPTCALRVRDALLRVDGVLSAEIGLERGLARLRVDPTRWQPSAVTAALAAAGDPHHPYTGRILSSL